MEDPFKNFSTGMTGPARKHFAIVPHDVNDLPFRPRAIVWQTDGTAVIEDDAGTVVTYQRFAGDRLEFMAKRVRTTSTATLVGWL